MKIFEDGINDDRADMRVFEGRINDDLGCYRDGIKFDVWIEIGRTVFRFILIPQHLTHYQLYRAIKAAYLKSSSLRESRPTRSRPCRRSGAFKPDQPSVTERASYRP